MAKTPEPRPTKADIPLAGGAQGNPADEADKTVRAANPMLKALSDVRQVLAYLTILPVSGKGLLTEEDFGRLPAYYPLAGLALGLGLFLCAKLLMLTAAPVTVMATILVALMVVFTRGFHLDGLADSMDALLSHRSREEKLAIMKDPRQGTFGVLSIVLDVLLRVQLVSAVLTRPDWATAIILFPVWGRLASSTVSAFSRYARPGGGLAHASVERSGFREFLIALGLTLALSLLFGFPPFLAALFAFLLSVGLILLWDKTMGGVTGDLLGASLEITETLCLLLYVLAF
ncbi:MAG: adenosylcobinamide-GDP ribazoletransferase [Deltaproteobacteria bacterium]|jgi:adenosylcobinamide-GDP ribazoletransferase|nr:adenosylcobinamide-GDP ribazoletransferase [Deltaproteobacteria bacterium]